jgi:hypothetical protein
VRPRRLILGTPAADRALRAWEERRLEPPEDDGEEELEEGYDPYDDYDPDDDYYDEDAAITAAENAYEARLESRY